MSLTSIAFFDRFTSGVDISMGVYSSEQKAAKAIFDCLERDYLDDKDKEKYIMYKDNFFANFDGKSLKNLCRDILSEQIPSTYTESIIVDYVKGIAIDDIE